MDLLILAIVIIGNIVLKSANDKKKIDRAKGIKEARTSQNQIPTKKTKGSFIEQLRDEIEKEIKSAQGNNKEVYKPINVNKKKTEQYINKPTENKQINIQYVEEVKPIINTNLEKMKTRNPTPKYNNLIKSKEDIVKGIIFSEILAEPLSIRKDRRSI